MLLLFFHLHSGIIGFHYPFPLPCKLFRNKDHHLTLGLINYRHKQHMSSQPYLRIVCRLGQILPVTSDKQSESQEGSGGLAWRTGAYQATLPLPFWTGQVRENKMENNSYIKIRHFTKAKVCAHISKDKKTPLFSTSHEQAMFSHLPGSRAAAHVAVALEGKHCK